MESVRLIHMESCCKPRIGRGRVGGCRKFVFGPGVGLLHHSRQGKSSNILFGATNRFCRRSIRVDALQSADLFQDTVEIGIVVTVVVAAGISSLPILTGDAKERNEERYLGLGPPEGEDEIKWSVMTVISFLPFLNPMAWVFAALDDDTSPTLYWSFAFLYALPYIQNGFQLNSFATTVLILGILHVQIERISQTEPVEVEVPELLRSVLKSSQQAFSQLTRYGKSLGGEVKDRIRQTNEAQKRRPDRKFLEQQSKEARAELEDFDQRQRQRLREKQNKDR